ncbi:hypothetical protein A2Y99_05010 [Candidatus Gottesmanbacteria bacterium RBG_13_37_7]|uniref:Thioredoxin-like fold domain-containing protein n=1 Tax=Candidatus Gottesmanbacteria bacterium RBG_13_37_7 TaxID=1798369 RepID=A0A1F5YHF8_9BACT|nr:MAG: hypothetical protein A2Y99_05010 [Candidatus Gottesmanbacteria bacterium RBG_13_37_7]
MAKKHVMKIKEDTVKESSINTNKKSFFSPSRIFLLIILIILGYLIYQKYFSTNKNNTELKNSITSSIKKVLGNESYKVSVDNLKETSGVYQFDLNLDTGSGNPQKYVSYISKDAKILFQSGIIIDSLNQAKPSSASEKQLSCNDLNKSDAPKLTAFVVSNCPYGLQTQRLFKQVINEQSSLQNNLDIKYIGSVQDGKITSMHGEKEAEENLRQICIREEQKDKFWDYLSCYMKEGKSEECLKTAGINTNALSVCTTDSQKGLKYAQADFDIQNKFNVSGSPTLILNNNQIVSESNFGGRIPNAIKEIICCSYNTKPEFCSKDLSKNSVAVSFSLNDTSTNSTNSANCGN